MSIWLGECNQMHLRPILSFHLCRAFYIACAALLNKNLAHGLHLVDEDPDSLHLLHLGDALLDVRHEPLLVVVRPTGEGGHNSAGVALLKLDSELEMLSAKNTNFQV